MLDPIAESKTKSSKRATTHCDELNAYSRKNAETETHDDEDYDWDNALVASDSVSLPDNSDDSVVGPLPQIHSTKKHVCDTSTHGTSTSSSMMSHDQSAYSSDSARAVPEHLMRIAEESDDEIVFERSLHSPRSYRISRMVQSVSPRWNRMYHRSPAKGASKFAFDDVSLGDSRASHMRDDNTEVATEIAGNLTSTKFQRDISDESVFSDTLALNSLVTPLEQNASEPMDFLDRTVAAVMEEKGPIQKIDKNQELTLPTGSQDLTEKIDSFDHAETKEFPRWMVVAFAAFGSMALIVAVVLIVVAGPNKLKDLVDGSTPVSASPGGERAKVMWEIASSVSGSEVLSDVDSHAFKAFSWLSQSDNTALTTPHDKLIDRYIVTLLYFATGGEGWEEQLNFLTEGSICGWNESNEGSKLPRGIVCDDKLRVKNLILTENKLGGTIPLEITMLKSLHTLNLSRNYISGNIPWKLGQLQGLREVNLMSNEISGRVPSELAALTRLISLDLSSNSLTGNLPSELGMLVGLERFSIGDNQLKGQIPDSFASLTSLTSLNIFRNQFTGTIPSSLSYLQNLTSVNFASNDFSGDISEDFCIPGREYNSFWADCRGDSPKVQCSCCTICCRGGGDILEC